MSSKAFGVRSDWGFSGNAGCDWKDLKHVVRTDQHWCRGVARLGGVVMCEPRDLKRLLCPQGRVGVVRPVNWVSFQRRWVPAYGVGSGMIGTDPRDRIGQGGPKGDR